MGEPVAFSLNLEGREFRILPLKVGGYVLSIDGQWTSFFARSEDAATACFGGHVATFITPINRELRPYLVSTSKKTFPSDLSGWNSYELELQEFSV
jgi:hypothetical protein